VVGGIDVDARVLIWSLLVSASTVGADDEDEAGGSVLRLAAAAAFCLFRSPTASRSATSVDQWLHVISIAEALKRPLFSMIFYTRNRQTYKRRALPMMRGHAKRTQNGGVWMNVEGRASRAASGIAVDDSRLEDRARWGTRVAARRRANAILSPSETAGAAIPGSFVWPAQIMSASPRQLC
jgi:hypothetical protein